MKTLSEIQEKVRSSVTLKVVTIGILMLILLIPMGMIKSLILEREQTRDIVINEINDTWGDAQTLTGPVLSVPYDKFIDSKADEIIKVRGIAHFLPESLVINGELIPEERYRGIYKVIVYSSYLEITGSFVLPDFEKLNLKNIEADWENAFVSFGVPDMRGIQNEVVLQWDDAEYNVSPGLLSKDLFSSGFTSKVNIDIQDDKKKTIDFGLNLQLDGSKQLYVIPAGKVTEVQLKSSWSNPNFDGAFLPDKRTIDESGFTANWKVLNLNRNFPQQWVGNAFRLEYSAFGVNLIIPVDQYQKSFRSAKYAIMFISLTFISFLFVEVLNRKKIHPVQYLLVSAGLMIFYVLLVSLSEQIGFNWAYLISSIAIIGLIMIYSASIFKSSRLTAILGFILTILYVFLYTILQLQDYSLLMGSIGLFTALALIMYLSRKINWYGNGVSKNNNTIQKSQIV